MHTHTCRWILTPNRFLDDGTYVEGTYCNGPVPGAPLVRKFCQHHQERHAELVNTLDMDWR